MNDGYACAVCGKNNVKLWRPYMDVEPLICAKCAEKRQTLREYDECEWKKEDEHYVGIHTGRKIPLLKWIVNEFGMIPSGFGPGPNGEPLMMSDQLIIDLKDISEAYSSGATTMIPAVPYDENGSFWGYTSAPQEDCEWWKNLPNE